MRILVIETQVKKGFGLIHCERNAEMKKAFENTVFPNQSSYVHAVDCDVFGKLDNIQQKELLDNVKPDFVFCRQMNHIAEYLLKNKADNIFTQRGIAIFTGWDDPFQALGSAMVNLNMEYDDCLESMREVFALNNLYMHSFDTGHIQTATELNLMPANKVNWIPAITSKFNVEKGRDNIGKDLNGRVCFAGNVYPLLASRDPFMQDKDLLAVSTRAIEKKMQDLSVPLWEILQEELKRLNVDIKKQKGIITEDLRFWKFYVFLFCKLALTMIRLGLIAKLPCEIDFYGMFADVNSQDYINQRKKINFHGFKNIYSEIPEIYNKSTVALCVSNSIVYQGTPSRVNDCIASGGLPLTDPKEDLVAWYGEDIKKLFFKNSDELNERVEYFLSNPNKRNELIKSLWNRASECSIDNYLRKVVEPLFGT